MWISIARYKKTHVGISTSAKAQLVYIHATTEWLWVWLRPKTFVQEHFRYGIVVVNRQQHSYSYLEGGHDWSVSGIVHLVHSSASLSAHRNQPMSSEIMTIISTLMKYQEILMHVYAHSAVLNCTWDRTQVSGCQLQSTFTLSQYAQKTTKHQSIVQSMSIYFLSVNIGIRQKMILLA